MSAQLEKKKFIANNFLLFLQVSVLRCYVRKLIFEASEKIKILNVLRNISLI